eukprot:TRINITY_DN4234_c2_g1_i1.p1 TRINITY_DN4234_c2_g1~~TRINITY_DN4234_c2_g1_i1.p1  ORF type:complete len:801 (+),score=261.08 TRINITY_DN4234_c2_g1_i1:55-2457(+)
MTRSWLRGMGSALAACAVQAAVVDDAAWPSTTHTVTTLPNGSIHTVHNTDHTVDYAGPGGSRRFVSMNYETVHGSEWVFVDLQDAAADPGALYCGNVTDQPNMRYFTFTAKDPAGLKAEVENGKVVIRGQGMSCPANQTIFHHLNYTQWDGDQATLVGVPAATQDVLEHATMSFGSNMPPANATAETLQDEGGLQPPFPDEAQGRGYQELNRKSRKAKRQARQERRKTTPLRTRVKEDVDHAVQAVKTKVKTIAKAIKYTFEAIKDVVVLAVTGKFDATEDITLSPMLNIKLQTQKPYFSVTLNKHTAMNSTAWAENRVNGTAEGSEEAESEEAEGPRAAEGEGSNSDGEPVEDRSPAAAQSSSEADASCEMGANYGLDMTYHFQIDIKSYKLQYLSSYFSGDVLLSYYAQCDADWTWEQTSPTTRLHAGTYDIQLGPVPLIVRPYFEINATVSLDADVSFYVDHTKNITYSKLGIEYTPSAGTTHYNDFTVAKYSEWKLEATLDVMVAIQPGAYMALEGLLTFGVPMQAGVQADVTGQVGSGNEVAVGDCELSVSLSVILNVAISLTVGFDWSFWKADKSWAWVVFSKNYPLIPNSDSCLVTKKASQARGALELNGREAILKPSALGTIMHSAGGQLVSPACLRAYPSVVSASGAVQVREVNATGDYATFTFRQTAALKSGAQLTSVILLEAPLVVDDVKNIPVRRRPSPYDHELFPMAATYTASLTPDRRTFILRDPTGCVMSFSDPGVGKQAVPYRPPHAPSCPATGDAPPEPDAEAAALHMAQWGVVAAAVLACLS